MALELKQSLRLAQQLVMTPQLQQAIKLLQLSRMELAEVINQEMLENPVLEELGEEEPVQPLTDEGEGIEPSKTEDTYEDLDWEKFFDLYDTSEYGWRGQAERDEVPSLETTLTKSITLQEHMTWQLRLSNFTLEEEKTAAQIIGNLDDDGYLKQPLSFIAQETGVSEDEVEQVLKKVQEFDPAGVAARDLRECLLLQLEQWGIKESLPRCLVLRHLEDIEKKDYRKIARAENVSIEQIKDAVRILSELEPKPGRPFGEIREQYITPDIYVYKVGDEYVIVLNQDGLPKLRVSSYYRQILQAETDSSAMARDYIQDKLRSALWLIRSIHQRQRTIYRVMESIVKFQMDFFDKGVGYLKPLVLRDVAEDIDMHESTVSRVTTNKYVHTPQGIFSVKFFFNSRINRLEGDEAVAAESVKDRIRQIIAREAPDKPYSDQEIVHQLREYNIDIARRTVTKYREQMGILASSRRKRV
jgi:RNA polymerase sigma-54 factor